MSGEKMSVTVRIAGEEHTIRANAEPAYTRRCAKLVDDRIHQIRLQAGLIDGGQELVPFQLIQNLALRRHRPPDGRPVAAGPAPRISPLGDVGRGTARQEEASRRVLPGAPPVRPPTSKSK